MLGIIPPSTVAIGMAFIYLLSESGLARCQ